MREVASPPSSAGTSARGRWLAVAVLGVATLTSSLGAAQPSVWEAARDPLVRRIDAQSLAAERLLQERVTSPADLVRVRLAVARLLAEIAANPPGAARSARLDAAVGALYSEPYVADYAAARAWLTRALAAAPPAPLAERAEFLLGVACAKLGDVACERGAYSRVLELATSPPDRATALMNRAEGRMLAGDLAGAVADFRQARRWASRPDLLSLVCYGLGVALDRSGNLPSALQTLLEARAAWTSTAPYSPLDDPDVFFVPPFDLYYYKGLEELAVARAAQVGPDPATAVAAFARAAGHFERYLVEAEPAGTPWVRHARAHLGLCRRAQAALAGGTAASQE